MSTKFDFLTKAIEDTQGTIRALDAKLVILISLLLLPLSKIWYIAEYFKLLSRAFRQNFLIEFLICLILSIWGLSFLIAVRGVGSISNPAAHIKGGNKPKGIFYYGGLFSDCNFFDSIFNRKNLMSKETIEGLLKNINIGDEDIETELVFEHAKITYIRQIKMIRLKWSFILSIADIFLAILSYSLLGLWFPAK